MNLRSEPLNSKLRRHTTDSCNWQWLRSQDNGVVHSGQLELVLATHLDRLLLALAFELLLVSSGIKSIGGDGDDDYL